MYLIKNKEDDVIKKGTIYSLQVIRAFAFLGIFLSHCAIGKFGAWGVSVFVILSGFLMIYSNYEKKIAYDIKNCIKFSFNKIKKLYILHVIMTIVAFGLVIPVIKSNFSIIFLVKEIIKMFLNLLLLQTWFPTSTIYFSMNGVSWYLSMSLFLYFCFPIIKNILEKIKAQKKIVLLALFIYLFQCFISLFLYKYNIEIPFSDNFCKWLIYICPIFRLGDFIMGCCVGYIFYNCKISFNKYFATTIELGILFIIWRSQYFYNNEIGFLGSESFKYNMLYTISSILIVFMFAINEGLISKICTNPVFIYIGNISSFAFLIHQIIIRCVDLIKDNLKMTLNGFCYVFVCFFITLVLSEFLYRKRNKNFIHEIK